VDKELVDLRVLPLSSFMSTWAFPFCDTINASDAMEGVRRLSVIHGNNKTKIKCIYDNQRRCPWTSILEL
jgi:hypothetical protein